MKNIFGGRKKSKKKKKQEKEFDNNEFEEFLTTTFGNDEKKKKMMRQLSKQQKIKLLNQSKIVKQKRSEEKGDIKDTPKFFIMELASFTTAQRSETEKAKTMHNLYINLRTKDFEWVKEFTGLKGFEKLFGVFVVYNSKVGHRTPYEKDIIKNCVLSTVLLIDSSTEGFEQFVSTPNSVREFAHALSSEDSEVRWKVLYMLTAVAIKSDELFELVLDAMRNVKLIRRESHTFELIVKHLKQDTKNENKLYCLTFLNVMIAKPKKVTTRQQILQNLDGLEIEKIISGLEEDLERQTQEDQSSKQIIESIYNQIKLLKEAMDAYKSNKETIVESDDINAIYESLVLRVGDDHEKKTYVNLLMQNILKRIEEMSEQQWEELLECSAGKLSLLSLKDRNRKLQSSLSSYKLKHDADRIKFSKERIAFAEEKVKVMKYLRELKVSLNGPTGKVPKFESNQANPIAKTMFEIVQSFREKEEQMGSSNIETSFLKQRLDESRKQLDAAEKEKTETTEQLEKLKKECSELKEKVEKLKETQGTGTGGSSSGTGGSGTGAGGSGDDFQLTEEEKEQIKRIRAGEKITFNVSGEKSSEDGEKNVQETGEAKKEGDESKGDEENKEGEDKKEDSDDEDSDDSDDSDDMPPPPGDSDSDDSDDDMPPPPEGGVMEEKKPKLPPLPERVPEKKMKVFHWDNIQTKELKKSIWIDNGIAENTKDIDIEEKKIEELFQAIERKIDDGPKIEKEPKVEKVCLLSGKRQQSLSIFVSRLRMRNDDLVNYILSLNENKLDLNTVQGLKAVAPKPEEIKAEKEYDGDTKLLDISDKFIRALMIIPRFEQRVSCWLFKRKFMDNISEIGPDIEIVIEGCEKLQDNKKWIKLLQIILAVGNFINGQNKKKVVHGFKIRTLNKLTTMKSGDRKWSFLSYIVNFISEKHPEVNEWLTELSPVKEAERVDIKGIGDEIAKLENERNKIVNEIKLKKESEPNPKDKFLSVFEEFLKTCDNEIADLKEKLEEMNSKLENVAELYGENKNTFPKDPSDFLAAVVKFMDTYEFTIKKLEKQKELEQRQQKRSKFMKERKQNKGNKPEGVLSGIQSGLFSGKMIRQERNRQRPGFKPPSALLSELSGAVGARKFGKPNRPARPRRGRGFGK